jgi:lathosterol oxidase
VQVAYIIATIMALDYLHDCWFYWTHRWLHSRLLYKRIHAQHHM